MRPRDVDGQPSESWVVFGQVVGIHIRDDAVRNGRFDMSIARPIGRMGYMDYCDAGDVFEMMRPQRR